jgi:ComF family protein
MEKADCLMPIPLHPARLREREFNQSELVARELSGQFDKPLADSLERHRFTKPQACLKEKSRLKNVKGAFRVKNPDSVKNKNILVVDDVATTASTVAEASKALKKAGAKSVSVITFARS